MFLLLFQVTIDGIGFEFVIFTFPTRLPLCERLNSFQINSVSFYDLEFAR
jgi:hypothetical protein